MDSTQTSQGAAPPDTQAILLLCGTFTRDKTAEAKPLNLTEYNALAVWLNQHAQRPADLLLSHKVTYSAETPGLPAPDRVRALLGRGFQMAAALEQWQRLGLWVIGRGEANYPERLRRRLRNAAPPLLYGAGDVQRLQAGGLAIVGSRDSDEESLSFTRRVAEICASEHIQVISGGARGVDQAAAAAAIGAEGGALAVLAERLDRSATARDSKGLLRRGQLTLVSPFEPEATFAIGRAMGRNKLIYALADHALLVRFTMKEGGTWSGAVEHLSRSKGQPAAVPVFVRVAQNPEEGWRTLQGKGAFPFPEEEFWRGNVTELLTRAAAPAAEPSTATSVSEIPLPALIDSCYSRCLPLLLQHLSQRPNEKQLAGVAQQLELKPQQLKAWLQRAITAGIVQKQKRPAVYLAAAHHEIPSSAETCYQRCLPLLLLPLREARSEQQLLELLDLLPLQLKEWLKKAVHEGKVKKKGKPAVYVDAQAGDQLPLFENDGDAA